METMDMFIATITVMLFYGFAITMISHAIPSDQLVFVTAFSETTSNLDLETISEEVQSSVERQTTIPVIDMGALVFYSGNILLDLIINFVYAIPQMIGLLVAGLSMLFNFDPVIVALVEMFATVMVSVMYFIGVVSLVTSIRSGRSVL